MSRPVDLVFDVTVVWRLSELGVGGEGAVDHARQQEPEQHLQAATELGDQHLPQPRGGEVQLGQEGV